MKKNTTEPKLPKVGDRIYVQSSFSISNGSSDVVGGLATVTEVDVKDYGTFVSVKEHPGRGYNWACIGPDQEKLKKEFGEREAYPDPDIDTPWLEEGDWHGSIDIHGNKSEGFWKGPPVW